MISIETGTYRFFTGDNVTYRDSEVAWLFEQAVGPDDIDMRSYAAAGLMRALLDTPVDERDTDEYLRSIDWATDVILSVQSGNVPSYPETTNVRDFIESLPPVNGVFDATSVTATKSNDPKITAAVISEHIPDNDEKLVIALGHGGILSSAATFSELPGNNAFYPLRFSKYKAKDGIPVLGDTEREHLGVLAEDRAVIVHDEDRGLGGDTLRQAVRFVNKTLGVNAFGVTPVLARNPYGLSPQIIRQDDRGVFTYDTYDVWSDKLKAVKAKMTVIA